MAPAPTPPILVDALTRDLLPQQPVQWSLIDINTLNFNQAGSFTMQVPATDANWNLITYDADGNFIPFALYVDWHGTFQVPLLVEVSAETTSVDATTGTVTTSLTWTGSDFLALLAARVAYPDGTKTWHNQTGSPVTYSGPAETVIKDIVAANTTTAGDTARRIPNFVIADDQGRGDTVSYTVTPATPFASTNGTAASNLGATLMDVIRTVAAQSLIGVSITLTDGQLVFDTYIPRDLSDSAVFATSLGNLRGDTLTSSVPTADVALIQSATTETITSSQSWTTPPGVNRIDVEVTGGGGGGAGAHDEIRSGGGGAGAEFSRATLNVVPGDTYTITIGAGGDGGFHNEFGHDGGDTVFTGHGDTITGHGGGGARNPVYYADSPGGPGGTGSIATVHRQGGDGGSGSKPVKEKDGFVKGGDGGGGGSSAGIYKKGNPGGSSGRGANAPPGGGGGGGGGQPGGGTGSNGTNGSSPGGGGGGGGTGPTGGFGGDGADGLCKITYLSAGASAFIESAAEGDAPTDAWRRVESYSSQVSTASATDIATTIASILTQGEALTSLQVTAIDTPALAFGNPAAPAQGYGLGDTVTVQIREGFEFTDMVTAVELAASTTGYVYLPQALSSNAVFQQTAPASSSATASSYIEFVAATIGSLAAPSADQTGTGLLVSGGSGGATMSAGPPSGGGQIPPGSIIGDTLAAGAALANIGPDGITPSYIQSLTASLIGNLGVLNGNPYLTGGDDSGWFIGGTGSGATLAVVTTQPAGSPYKYALKFVMPGSGGPVVTGGSSTSINAFPIAPSTQYLISGLFYCTGTSLTLGFDWWNGTTFESSGTESFTVTPNTWTQLTAVITSPSSGSTIGSPHFTTTASNTIYAEAVICMPQVPGALIEAGTVTATQIAAGTITAALLVADIVVAGIVDGTLLTGAQLVLTDANGADVSITFDGSGNAFLQFATNQTDETGTANMRAVPFNTGAANYFEELLIGGPEVSGSAGEQILIHLASPKNNAPGTAFLSMTWQQPTADGGGTFLHAEDSVAGFEVVAGKGTGVKPGTGTGTTGTVQESWHTATLGNGWTGSLLYKKCFENEVAIRANVLSPGTLTSGTALFTLPTGYRPLGENRIAAMVASTAMTETPSILIESSGAVEIAGLPASTTSLSFSGRFPLD